MFLIKNINIDNLIFHTDNGLQYYHKDFIDYANKNNFKLSKKKPYKFGYNAMSQNTFYHLVVE
ncbi:transposase family protein [Spiroplasma syrphidicola]|uniref:transposase family protein n=1 Tax=Spiroplasma syrphidicola TaxID=216945 RepID=UPI0003A7A3F0|nr:transposase family protein [Spiroplasma syrphidicola]